MAPLKNKKARPQTSENQKTRQVNLTRLTSLKAWWRISRQWNDARKSWKVPRPNSKAILHVSKSVSHNFGLPVSKPMCQNQSPGFLNDFKKQRPWPPMLPYLSKTRDTATFGIQKFGFSVLSWHLFFGQGQTVSCRSKFLLRHTSSKIIVEDECDGSPRHPTQLERSVVRGGGESNHEIVSFCFVRACVRARGLVA